MSTVTILLGIAISALLTNNIILGSAPLGVCPFLGVSKKTSGAIGMGVAVTFVIALSSMLCYFINTYLLVPYHLEYLQIILFILIIASLVQVVEIVLKRFSPTIYNAMGIYLPLITTNCAVLGTAQKVAIMTFETALPFLEVVIYSIFIGLGFMLALILMAGVRERISRSPIPKPFRGFPIALLAAGLIAMAFVGVSGISF